MPFGLPEIFMVAAFLLGSYSIVGNDSIQTLGTFLSSNSHRPWWVLYIFSASIMTVVLIYGFIVYEGDTSYGRLEQVPYPEGGINWIYATPPLVLLILTRFGIPVSTTFLILTIFTVTTAAGDVLTKMLIKSGLGYVVAATAGFVLFLLVFRRATEYFNRTHGEEIPRYWVVLQWCSTGFLWSQWIIQDIANIFVFFPRTMVENPDVPGEMIWKAGLTVEWFLFGLISLLLLQAYLFYQSGGPIQKIVRSKTGTHDIRAATIIDFIYGVILFIFKEVSNIPMSTTWVFLGLLAGREIAISLFLSDTELRKTWPMVLIDGGKALFGLVISVAIAFGLPWVAAQF